MDRTKSSIRKSLDPLILESLSHLDERNKEKIVALGCSAVQPLADFLELSDEKKIKWCETKSLEISQKPFVKPNPHHPLQYVWILNDALKKILQNDDHCRHQQIQRHTSNIGFSAALASAKNETDAELILKVWASASDKIANDIVSTPFSLHLQKKEALPLLIKMLESSQNRILAAETLIFLTGKESEALEIEQLPPSLSRRPLLKLKSNYFRNPQQVHQVWLSWWKQNSQKIHWAPDQPIVFAKDTSALRRTFNGKFSW